MPASNQRIAKFLFRVNVVPGVLSLICILLPNPFIWLTIAVGLSLLFGYWRLARDESLPGISDAVFWIVSALVNLAGAAIYFSSFAAGMWNQNWIVVGIVAGMLWTSATALASGYAYMQTRVTNHPGPTVMLFLGLLAGMGLQPAAAQEWPQLEPEVHVADGFRQTAWYEAQLRDGTWTPNRRQLLTYDDAGRLHQITHQSILTDDWRTSQQETFTYGEDGTLAKKLIQVSIGNRLENRGRHTYTHDEAGRRVEEILEGWSYEQRWQPLFRYTLTYDDAGQLIEHETATLQKDMAPSCQRILMQYDAQGRLDQEVQLRKQEGAWVEAARYEYTYDAEERLTEKSGFYSKGGGGWVEMVRLVYAYDEAGRRAAVATLHRGPTDAFQESARRVFTYDEHGNQIETLHQARQEDAWQDARQETYTYEPER